MTRILFIYIFIAIGNSHSLNAQLNGINHYNKSVQIEKNSMRTKLIIDSNAIKSWITLGNEVELSNNGKYFSYIIHNQPRNGSTIVVQSINSNLKREFYNALGLGFSSDSKKYIFKVKDSIFYLLLNSNSITYTSNVTSWKQPRKEKGKWIAYYLNKGKKELVLRNLISGEKKQFYNVTDYVFSDNGSVLLLKSFEELENRFQTALLWINLLDGTTTKIWSIKDSNQQTNTSGFNFDTTGKHLVFLVQERKENVVTNSIWYYNSSMDRAVMKASNNTAGIDSALSINDATPNFSNDGKYIFFQLQQSKTLQPNPQTVKLDIWSYRDTVLQSTQFYDLGPKNYSAAIKTDANKIIRLELDNEKVVAYPQKSDFVVIRKMDAGDRFWMYDTVPYWLLSLKDGSRKFLVSDKDIDFAFSPGGKYLVYYSTKVNQYISYDLTTDKFVTLDMLGALPPGTFAIKDEYFVEDKYILPVGIGGWFDEDSGLLVYDNYDLWKLDPKGIQSAVNITNSYGQKNHIKFRLMFGQSFPSMPVVISGKEPLLLNAFNTKNKYNGFYKKNLGKKGDPDLLTMGPYTFCHYGASMLPRNSNEFDDGMLPLRAKNKNIWIIKRQTHTESPNYFLTKDFRSYKALTDLQFQKSYNWIKAELVSWEQLDGKTTQGILYKPENFDPNKKYPLIINYYQQLSHRIYEYPRPDFVQDAHLNIPWFVSREYLVFTPDILYIEKGKLGRSAYNTVVSAAQWLSKKGFVDSNKIGISGHSFAGFETNYIVTHTELFAAAFEGAGTSNWVSSSLQFLGKGGKQRSRLQSYEGYMGASLWQNPDLYFENSPVLKAHKVTTPLLMFHCKGDGAVPWEQALEFFISLRRLNRKVWLLQYDNGSHAVNDKDSEDLTIRVTQYFDHYLKGLPPPRWMTEGVPARLKGIETKLELDTSGKQP